jgi:hypothetical protein
MCSSTVTARKSRNCLGKGAASSSLASNCVMRRRCSRGGLAFSGATQPHRGPAGFSSWRACRIRDRSPRGPSGLSVGSREDGGRPSLYHRNSAGPAAATWWRPDPPGAGENALPPAPAFFSEGSSGRAGNNLTATLRLSYHQAFTQLPKPAGATPVFCRRPGCLRIVHMAAISFVLHLGWTGNGLLVWVGLGHSGFCLEVHASWPDAWFTLSGVYPRFACK